MGSLQFNVFSTYFCVALFLLIVNVTAQLYQKIEGRHQSHHTMCSGQTTLNVTSSGIILSPGNYRDHNYPPNMNCKIQLRIRRNKKLKISFRFLNLEKSPQCSNDRLIISRQTSKGLSKIDHFCGSEKPANLIVDGPSIIIQFVSNHVKEFDGFVISYSEVDIKIDPSCPKLKILNVIKSGVITSPGFENGRYPPNKNCEYILRIPANKILKITFNIFSLEDSKVCNDSLTIYRKTSSLHQIGKWCGNKKPNDIFVKGPEILIRFNSDQRIERRGFRLHYSITKQHSQGCGTRNVVFQSNIFRGNKVKSPLNWPWMVSLNLDSFQFCAGTILDEYWILTSGHCFGRRKHLLSNISIRAGHSNLSKTTSFKISELIFHPRFMFPQDDIALIRLQTPLNMSDTIRPICFKDYDVKSAQNCYIAGWGHFENEPTYTEDLYEAKVDIWDENLCKARVGYLYTDTMICARGKNKENTCKGDSGGPLMCSDQSGTRWSVVGVTSFGEDCTSPNAVPVYAKVSAFADWIQKTMSNFQEN